MISKIASCSNRTTSVHSTYVLRKEEWLVKSLGDTVHDSRVAEHAVLFSHTNPEINPFLDDLTSTPNTAMGEAI